MVQPKGRGMDAGKRCEVPSCRRSPESNSIRIHAMFGGIASQPAHCAPNVEQLTGVNGVRCQPVVDADHHVSLGSEMLREVWAGRAVL